MMRMPCRKICYPNLRHLSQRLPSNLLLLQILQRLPWLVGTMQPIQQQLFIYGPV